MEKRAIIIDEDETEPVGGVTVGKTRRVVFTASSIVTFAWCYLSSYWWLVDDSYEHFGYSRSGWWWYTEWGMFFGGSAALQLIAIGLAVGSLPVLLLSFSVSSSPAKLGDLHVIWSALIFCGCGAWSWWVGNQDFEAVYASLSGPERAGLQLRREMRAGHDASWIWLLMPIFLTTGFVTLGAWRRAVRDADVRAGTRRRVLMDVQEANSRRISFTALSLVLFWWLAYQLYGMGCAWFYDRDLGGLVEIYSWFFDHGEFWDYPSLQECAVLCLLAGSLSLIPAAALSLSRHNTFFRLPDHWTLAASTFLFMTLAWTPWWGMDDAYNQLFPNGMEDESGGGDVASAKQGHTVSWFFVLTPIFLSTAFIIASARRRAIRDAVVLAAGGEE